MIGSVIRYTLMLALLLPLPALAAGPLLLVGGGLKDDNAVIYQRLVQLAGGSQARIGVITAASIPPSQDPDAGTANARNSKSNGEFYAQLLKTYGAQDAQYALRNL